MKNLHSIALLPGDGIGPDVTAEAVKCLHAVEDRAGRKLFEFEELSVGAGEYLRSETLSRTLHLIVLASSTPSC